MDLPKPKIRHILCAVRGVPKSRETVTKAIDLALEHKARLTFSHVTSANFLVSTTTMMSLQNTLKHLRDLSEFTMLVLVDRAQRRGVPEADYIIRDGQILTELSSLVEEQKPDILVIGKPSTDPASDHAFEKEELDAFIKEIEQRYGNIVITV